MAYEWETDEWRSALADEGEAAYDDAGDYRRESLGVVGDPSDVQEDMPYGWR